MWGGMFAIATVFTVRCGIGCDRCEDTVRSGKGIVTAISFRESGGRRCSNCESTVWCRISFDS